MILIDLQKKRRSFVKMILKKSKVEVFHVVLSVLLCYYRVILTRWYDPCGSRSCAVFSLVKPPVINELFHFTVKLVRPHEVKYVLKGIVSRDGKFLKVLQIRSNHSFLTG
jgi:hypothetical protein